MSRAWVWAAGALASTIAVAHSMAEASPVDLVPPGFGDPAPTPAPTPTATTPASPTPAPAPDRAPAPSAPRASSPSAPDNLPTLRELESLSTDDLDELLGLRPRVDIPPAAARATDVIGVIGPESGGVGDQVFVNQPAALVRAALAGNEGRYVSRWGHILMRRALSSAVRAPSGMDPIAFAGLRAGVLNRMGEYAAARALVQSVDTANYDDALTQMAIEAYLGSGDVIGACPAVRLSRADRSDGEWRMLRAICNAYAGETSRANTDLRRILNSGEFPRIDALLAQRLAGAAGDGRRAVTIEWDGVDSLSRWRFALANAVGATIPQELLDRADPDLTEQLATTSAVPLPDRVASAGPAAKRGILSGQALIDLYSQIALIEEFEGAGSETATTLRRAYVADTLAARLEALGSLWSDESGAGHVLTAQAAARIPVEDAALSRSDDLIRAMLTGGYDRNAALWRGSVADGSLGWAMLAVADPGGQAVSDGEMSDFVGEAETHRARMLYAGLAGLGRLQDDEQSEYGDRLEVDLGRQTRWTRAIAAAGQAGNPGMVALLAGLGMQGSDWSTMTALHLYHIVRALDAAGMNAEARMIAAEAVAQA